MSTTDPNTVTVPPAGGWPSMSFLISATVQRDYIARGVFPEFHATDFLEDLAGARIEEIVEDAKAMRFSAATPGLKLAYTCLIKRATGRASAELRHAAQARSESDPLVQRVAEEIRRSLARSDTWGSYNDAANGYPSESATWRAGDRVRTISGRDVEIVDEHMAVKVRKDDGPHVDADGVRFAWRRGYSAGCLADGKVYFFPAGDLRYRDGSPSHLRLVRRWQPEEIERQEVGVRAVVVHRSEAREARAVARMFEACGIKRPVVLTGSREVADSGRS